MKRNVNIFVRFHFVWCSDVCVGLSRPNLRTCLVWTNCWILRVKVCVSTWVCWVYNIPEDTCIVLEEMEANQQVWASVGTLTKEKKRLIMSGLGCLNMDGLEGGFLMNSFGHVSSFWFLKYMFKLFTLRCICRFDKISFLFCKCKGLRFCSQKTKQNKKTTKIQKRKKILS